MKIEKHINKILRPPFILVHPLKYICNCDGFVCSLHTSGVLVPGEFDLSGVEGKIVAIEWARTKFKPFLDISLGLQCAVIEFA